MQGTSSSVVDMVTSANTGYVYFRPVQTGTYFYHSASQRYMGGVVTVLPRLDGFEEVRMYVCVCVSYLLTIPGMSGIRTRHTVV